jgi:hypothetical protein
MRVPTVNSLPRILGPKELTRSAIAEAADASAFLTRTRDEKGRKLWLTDHNDICENCLGTGNMLLCSYCNTAWHLHCTAEAFSEAPTGYWMCSMCVEAERGGEDMMQHGLEDEDDAAGDGFDPSVDADDEEGDTDISQAAYDKAGIRPYSPNIWDASTMAALQRVLEPHPLPEKTRATAVDNMLNGLKSKHGLSLPVMVGIDAILSYLMENPEETFTPARQRIKDLTEESQKVAPIVLGTRRRRRTCSYAASYLVVHAGCAMRAHRRLRQSSVTPWHARGPCLCRPGSQPHLFCEPSSS